MKFPLCGTENEPNAVRCDCGFDFTKGVSEKLVHRKNENDVLALALSVFGWLLIVLCIPGMFVIILSESNISIELAIGINPPLWQNLY